MSEYIGTLETGFAVAIDGPAGSGKTSFAERLAEIYGVDPECQIIHADHYFEPVDKPGVDALEGAPGGFNVGRFMTQVGDSFNDPDVPLRVQEYNWQTDSYIDRPPPNPKQLIVVEGIKLIGLPVYWGAKVWMHVPRSVRKQRFLNRNPADRRMPETDQAVLLDRFNLWADDADAYEEFVSPHEGRTITVVRGDIIPAQQLVRVLSSINSRRPKWVDPPKHSLEWCQEAFAKN